MILDMLKGFLVGMCASAPIGPIAILVVQKSLSKGHKAGFVSGLGASVVDTFYASLAIFALAFAQRFLEDHRVLILIVGGIVLAALGLSMALKNPFRKMKSDTDSSVSPKDFGHDWRVASIILSVSAGSVTYWFSISWLLSRFRNRFKMNTILWISRVTGAIIVIIGIALLGQGLFMVIFQGMPIQ